MLKTAVLLLGIVFSGSVATRFLFGIELKCPLDDVFTFTIWHMERDDGCPDFKWNCWNPDDEITHRKTLTAYKKLFFYQDGADNGDSGSRNYEPYGMIIHNCSSKGYKLIYRHNLLQTSTNNGLEYIEYTLNLLNKSGEGGQT